MPQHARIVVPGCPHHVPHRGDNRRDVFFVDDDRRACLGLLQSQAARFGLIVGPLGTPYSIAAIEYGVPNGSDSSLSRLGTALGRRLRPQPVGRPRKRKMGKTTKIK